MKKFLKSVLPRCVKNYISEYRRQQYCYNKFKYEELNTPGNYYSLNAFDYYKCIFIHIPKTAGVSINSSLFGNLTGGHKTIRDYQNIYTSRTFEQYFKFAVVRNPYDRLYSAWNFLKQGGFDKADKKWADENLKAYTSFEHFVKEWITPENIYNKNHFVPQYEFLIDKGGNVGVNFVGKLENIDTDFKIICKKIGINRSLMHLNRTNKTNQIVFDSEMKKIIETVYLNDFEHLSY